MSAKFLTTSEVAETLRIGDSTARWWRHTGFGPKGFKVGRRVLYDADELERWIAEQRAAEVG